ncbi:MAG: hypothetical protein PVI89_12335 [Desulfobacteraceae bacterium]|jgi:hypothetical protein
MEKPKQRTVLTEFAGSTDKLELTGKIAYRLIASASLSLPSTADHPFRIIAAGHSIRLHGGYQKPGLVCIERSKFRWPGSGRRFVPQIVVQINKTILY